MADMETFQALDMRIGTIVEAQPNKKSRNSAYKLKIDFGPDLGVKKSSAQITMLYKPENLVGRKVVCVTNLPPIHIGDITSEVRVLGTDSRQGVVLLTPGELSENGDRVF